MLYQTGNPHGGDVYGEPVRLDYSANTNPFGTPRAVLDAVTAALPELHRYPDPYCRALVSAIAEHEGLPKEYILCGSGAAELIYSYCEAVHPRKASELAPTFSEYALGLRRFGGTMVRYALQEADDFVLEDGFLTFLQEEQPEVIFLCNPNNPTGQLIPAELLNRILLWCRENGARLFLDECFLDLADSGESMAGKLSEFPELLILRAFTKSYGMAGIRLGYCLCSDRTLLTRMSEAVQPWNVSTVAQAAGVAALKQGAFLAHSREVIFAEREWLRCQLEGCGIRVCTGHANYLLFRADPALGQALRKDGIAIRSCANYHGLDENWYRIAVRLHDENETLIAAIRQHIGRK